jgi:SAM-dependent methyltransferase
VQLGPAWTEGELNVLYANYSKKKDFKGQKRKAKISKYLPKYIGQENKAKLQILEVGCGYGDNLSYLYDQGYHTIYGIDKDPAARQKSFIHTVDWKDFNPEKKEDVIYGIHFLEHVTDPKKFLEWTIGHLKKGGKFIFEVPCIEDPLRLLYKNKAYLQFYWYPYHLFFYNKKTLEAMFCGLKARVIRRQEYGLINHLRWAILRRPGNWNPHIPILDDVYKWALMKLGYSDTLVVVGANV